MQIHSENPPCLREHIKKELLTYLGNSPQTLHYEGEKFASGLALNLGNCLCWLSASLDGKTPQHEQPIGETPQSIFALGRLLQQVAREMMERDSQGAGSGHAEQAVKSLTDEVRCLETRIGNLEIRFFEKGVK